MPRKVDSSYQRADARIPMEIPVVLDGHRRVPGAESTFTENVSARGARVMSVRRWEPDERVMFASRTGEFRSSARVAYCHQVQGDGFAIGLEFIEPKGRWVVQSPKIA